MKKEVAKYHNDLNTIAMRNWSSEEMNLFFAIITQLRDEGTKEIKFGKDELKELAKSTIDHNQRFSDVIEKLAKKAMQISYIEKTSNSYTYMPLFAWFHATWSNDLSDMSLSVEVTDKFSYILNWLNAEFTTWELEEFTSIRSTYAKTVYRLLKQWRTKGKREFKFDEFKMFLDMPSYYTPSEIDKNVLAPVKKELPKYFTNLKIKKVKANKKGNPVIAYEFTWEAEQTEKYDPQKYVKATKSKKLTAQDLCHTSNERNYTQEFYDKLAKGNKHKYNYD